MGVELSRDENPSKGFSKEWVLYWHSTREETIEHWKELQQIVDTLAEQWDFVTEDAWCFTRDGQFYTAICIDLIDEFIEGISL